MRNKDIYLMPRANNIMTAISHLFRMPAHIYSKTCSLLLSVCNSTQIKRLRDVTCHAPLILQVETINACNAACVFCAYSGMKRKKGIMSLTLFEQIMKDYAAMGGWAVSLTPIVGDALLDPHLLERLRIVKNYPRIKQISLTTNCIALDAYSNEEVRYILESLYCIQVSIGGLDADTYEKMYGVNEFARVEQALQRLVSIKASCANGASLTFAFRTSDNNFMAHFKDKIGEYQKRGVFVSNMWAYANYGGQLGKGTKIGLQILGNRGNKNRTCIYPRIHTAVCWDGAVLACSCTDLECSQLKIGHLDNEHLQEILSGNKRISILDSFKRDTPADICRKCSAYRPDTDFAFPYFSKVHFDKPLPLDFFHNMMS